MAAYLNRTISMVSGNGYDALTDANAPRTFNHANNDVSPLQIFVKAKKKINDIFGEIEDYVTETTVFIDSKSSSSFTFYQTSKSLIPSSRNKG
jgi:mitofusin 2